jgi:hypothetical protein
VASDQRARDANRIRVTTRVLLYGSLGATAVFGGLAARATHTAHAARASDSSGAVSSDDSSDDGFGGAVPPVSSTQPPVTQSGGS